VEAPTGAFDWSDVEVLCTLSVPAADGAEGGIVARHKVAGGATSFYRLRLVNDATSQGRVDVRLDKLSGGAVTVLAARADSKLRRAVDHQLSLVVRGARLEAYVDGVQLLAAEDKELASGAAGLYATGPGTSVANLWVSDLAGRP
jgi:hypothetical protein